MLGLALAFAASAAAEVRNGSATDGTEPERISGSIDITGVTASYDTAGSVSVAITTAARRRPPKKSSFSLRFGVLSGGECVSPIAVLVGTYARPPPSPGPRAGKGNGSESVFGTTTTLAARSRAREPALQLRRTGDLRSRRRRTRLLPPRGPHRADPAGRPPAPPAPRPHRSPRCPRRHPPGAEPTGAVLTSRRRPSPSIATSGRRSRSRSPTRERRAGKVALKIGKAHGVAIKPKTGELKLKSIAAGKSKIASFKVQLTPKAKPSSKLKLSVTGAKGVKATGRDDGSVEEAAPQEGQRQGRTAAARDLAAGGKDLLRLPDPSQRIGEADRLRVPRRRMGLPRHPRRRPPHCTSATGSPRKPKAASNTATTRTPAR